MQLIPKLTIHSWLSNNKGKINRKMERYEEKSFEVCNSTEDSSVWFVCLNVLNRNRSIECTSEDAQSCKRGKDILFQLSPNIQDSLLNANMCHHHWYYFYRDIWLPVFQTFSLSIQRIVFGAIAFNLYIYFVFSRFWWNKKLYVFDLIEKWEKHFSYIFYVYKIHIACVSEPYKKSISQVIQFLTSRTKRKLETLSKLSCKVSCKTFGSYALSWVVSFEFEEQM